MPEVPADPENVPAGHVEQCPAAVATLPVRSYLPAGHAWRRQRTKVQQQGQSTAAGFEATGTIGTRSKRAEAPRVTWQVFTTALEFNVTLP